MLESLLNKVAGLKTFFKVFSCEYFKIFWTSIFYGTPLAATSEHSKVINTLTYSHQLTMNTVNTIKYELQLCSLMVCLLQWEHYTFLISNWAISNQHCEHDLLSNF